MIDGVPNDKIDSKFNAERRKFGQMVLGGTLGAAALFTPTAMSPATVHQNAPGIKLCGQFPAKPTDDDEESPSILSPLISISGDQVVFDPAPPGVPSMFAGATPFLASDDHGIRFMARTDASSRW